MGSMAEPTQIVQEPVAAPPAVAAPPPVQTPAQPEIVAPVVPPVAPAATPATPPAPMPVIIVEAPKTAAQLTIDKQSAISAVDKAYGRK